MYFVVKLRFVFPFRYFPQDKALRSYVALIPEISQTTHLQFKPKPMSSSLEMEAKFYFQG